MKNYLLEYSEKLAVDIAELCKNISGENNTCFQINKSSSNVYANIREANYGQSSADMVAKFEIAPKESNETEGWLKILYETNVISDVSFKEERNLCGRIRRLLISSIKTLKTKI